MCESMFSLSAQHNYLSSWQTTNTVLLPHPHLPVAAVRVGAFACMSRLVARMDQGEAEAMLGTAVKVGACSCT